MPARICLLALALLSLALGCTLISGVADLRLAETETAAGGATSSGTGGSGGCSPSCDGRECGSDSCDGTCGLG